MPFAHSNIQAETTERWDFNTAVTKLGICLDREAFHAYITGAGIKGELTPHWWYRYWECYVADEAARDEQATISDALAARHW